MVRKLASAIIVASALNAAQVNALGLGELQLHSALNEPLNAEIKLLSVGDLTNNQILVKLANQDDFEKAGVDRNFFLTDLKFTVQLDGKGNGVIKIKTRRLVNEPYLNFVVEAKWPAGKLLREYTSLLDLPIYTEEKTSTTVNLGTTSSASTRTAPVAKDQPRKTQPPVQRRSPVSTAPRYDGENYQIAKNDTLWAIASKVRPSNNVSIQQTIVALQQLNPEAFVNNNINRLKAGHVLRVPDEQLVRDINVRYAMREVAAQNKAWQGEKLGAQVDATPRGAEPSERVEREGGRLSLSSAATSAGAGADAAGSGDLDALQNRLASSEEGLDKATRDNADLRTEVGDLQAQLDTMQRLVELKDDQLAALQGNVASVEAKPEESEQTADMSEESLVQSEEQAQAPAAEVSTEAVQPETIEPKAKKPLVAMKPPAEKGLLDQLMENPLYLGSALLALLLLVVGVVIKRRSGAESEESLDDVFAESETEFNEVFDEEIADELEEVEAASAEEVEPVEEEPVAAMSETGDAIGEADIYVAYGRFQHAIDLLKNSISSEQERTDLRLKLLEVYLEAGDQEGFQQQFVELQSLSDEDAIGQAKDMLSSVEDASDWLDDIAGDVSLDEGSMESVDEQHDELSMDDVELDLDALDDSEDIDGREKPIEYDTEDLGIDLDSSADSSADAEEDDLDIGVEFEAEDISESVDDEVEDSFSLDTVEEESVEDFDDALEDIDLDLDLDAEASSDVTDEVDLDLGEGFDFEETSDTDESDDLDIDLDLGEGLDDEEVVVAGEPDEPGADLDLGSELDLDLGDELESFDADDLDAAADTELSEDAAGDDDGEGSLDDEFEFLSDADEVATKLDLARAYIDMGDVDGAKDILDEVLQEGEEAQKTEANNLLERLG